MSRLTFYMHLAMVRIHHGFDVTQTETESLDIVQVAGMYPVKPVEDMLAGFAADAQPVVANRHLNAP